MLCLVSQLKTLNQNADAFEYQAQVGGVLSMPLVERATLWLAQSMLEEQIFPIQMICRDLGRYSAFFPDGSIQAGEGSLLLLLSNSLIAFMII